MKAGLDKAYKLTEMNTENEYDIEYTIDKYAKQKLMAVWANKDEIKHYIG